MKDLFDGELFDLLPVPWKTDETDAVSYALRWAVGTVLDLAKKTRIRAEVDDLSERTLDIMAVEMRAPYYDQDLPIETKREIIKRTIRWYMHAGTPSALEELMTVVFGSGEVIENWDFDDFEEYPQPYTFDLLTSAQITLESRAQMLNMIHRVKNVRSHLRNLIYQHPPIDVDVTIGVAVTPIYINHLPELDKLFDYGRGPALSVEGASVAEGRLVEIDKNADYSRGPRVTVDGNLIESWRLAERDKMADFKRGPHVAVGGSAFHADLLAERDKSADYQHGVRTGVRSGTIAVQTLRNLDD